MRFQASMRGAHPVFVLPTEHYHARINPYVYFYLFEYLFLSLCRLYRFCTSANGRLAAYSRISCHIFESNTAPDGSTFPVMMSWDDEGTL